MTHYSSLRLYWQEHCCGVTFQGFPQASLFLRAAFCPEGCSHTLSPPPSLPQDDRASSEIILSLSSDTLMTITGYCGTPVCRQLGPACVCVSVPYPPRSTSSSDGSPRASWASCSWSLSRPRSRSALALTILSSV